MNRPKYRSDIDGLRAIAIVPVLLFHAGVSIAPGGYVGVDVFFVISGFLLAQILFAEIETGDFSIAAFYERRIVRILPALIAVCGVTTIVACVVLLPPDLEKFGRSVISAMASVSNFYFWKQASYFEATAHTKPLLHTWSLSVEEQFYVLLPLAIFAIKRRLNNRFALYLGVVAVCSFAASALFSVLAPVPSFFLLPTRAWELLLGTLLARLPRTWSAGWQRTASWAGMTGLALIAYSVWQFDSLTVFPGIAAIVPCGGAALVVAAGSITELGPAHKLLSWFPLRYVGRLSYSLYLVHWPVLALFHYASLREPTGFETMCLLTAMFALADLSLRFVEQPFRRRRGMFRRSTVFYLAGAAVALMSVMGSLIIVTDGFRGRYPDLAFDPRGEQVKQQAAWRVGECFLMQHDPATSWLGEKCFLRRGSGPTVLLWGDSFAAHYTPGIIASRSDSNVSVLLYAAAACPPIIDQSVFSHCANFSAGVRDVIRKYDVDVVVIAARWSGLRTRVTADSIRNTLQQLHRLGVSVYVLGQSPVFSEDVTLIDYRANHQRANGSFPVAFDPSVNAILGATVRGAHFIDPMQFNATRDSKADDGVRPYKRDGTFLYFDTGHFTEVGSIDAVNSYFPFLKTR